jgi:PAS domain S-box-containing protein
MADQDELNESLQRLISLIESSDDAIIGKDLNGTIVSWNNGATLGYGYSPAEAVGKSISIIIPPEGRAEFVDILERIKRGEKVKHYETVRVRKDGTRIDVSLTVSPIINKKGEIVGASTIARDITERKHAYDALQEREKRYRMLVENAAEAILVVQDGMIQLANPAAAAMTGFSEQEILSNPFPLFIHPDDRAMVTERHQKRLKGDPLPTRYEFRVLAKDGSTKWMQISAAVIGWEGRPATLNLLTDITKRRAAEELLRESEKKYQLLVNSAAEAILVIQDEIIRVANPMAVTMTGFSEQELLSKPFPFLIHPDDRAMAKELHQKRLKGEAGIRYEFRMIVKDGSTKWIEISGVLIEWEGSPATLNLLMDITARKLAELDLASAVTRLKDQEDYIANIVSAENVIVVGLDGKGLITLFNAGAERITGYSKREVINKPVLSLLRSGGKLREHYSAYERFLKDGGMTTVEFEAPVLTRSGETRTISWFGRKMLDRGGEMAFTLLGVDTTKRRTAEESLVKRTEDAEVAKVRAHAYFDFLAHDIANLLSPIMAYAELMSLDPKTPEPCKIKAGKIVNQARRASSFILSLRRLEDAELMTKEQMEAKNLGTILDEAITKVKAEYGDKRISATVVHPPEQVKFIGGKHLESIIVGIFEDSVAVTDRDDIALEVKATIVGEKDRKFLRLELTDDGPGISDDLKECFIVSKDPRKRFEKGITRGVASSLLISSAIVAGLGGELRIENRIPGDCSKGSRIVIEFPQEGFFGT